jgi:membrane fusion protein
MSSLVQERIDNESRREIFITAPKDGTVSALQIDRGKLVTPGQSLMSIVPNGAKMQVDVYLPARAVGFVREGARALLQYQAFPYQKFGSHKGEVLNVSRTGLTSSELPFPAQKDELYYLASVAPERATVRAYGKEYPLQSGMVVDVSLLLDTRTLLEWLFEPLFAISGK